MFLLVRNIPAIIHITSRHLSVTYRHAGGVDSLSYVFDYVYVGQGDQGGGGGQGGKAVPLPLSEQIVWAQARPWEYPGYRKVDLGLSHFSFFTFLI